MYIDSTNGETVEISRESLIKLAKNTEGLKNFKINKKFMYCYDSLEDDREIIINFPEFIKLRNIFEFNTLNVNKIIFFSIVNNYIGKEKLININKIFFINNEEELIKVYEEYSDENFDMNKIIGMHCYMDNIILINAKKIREMAVEEADEFYNLEEEFAMGLWETLIHEIRHSECSNPIIPREFISENDAIEDNVEKYCLDLTHQIELNENYTCFK